MPAPRGHRQYLAPGEKFLARIGSQLAPPPADLRTHGGYGVRVRGTVLGPWAYYEHAADEARRRGGLVVLFKTCRKAR